MPRHGSMFVKQYLQRFIFSAGTALILGACTAAQSDSESKQSSADLGMETPFVRASNSPSGSYLAGIVAGHNRDYEIATELMLHALEASPDDPRLLARSFLLTASTGRNDEALELAKRLLDISPQQSIAHLVLVIDAVEREDWDEVRERIDATPDVGVNTILEPMFTAWTDLAQNDLDKALENLEPLSKKEGFQSLYGIQVALLKDLGGRPDAARKDYLSLLETSEQPTLRQVNIVADFLSRQGDKEAARGLITTYLEQDPENAIANHALSRLDSDENLPRIISKPGDAFAEILFGFASLHAQEKAYDTGLIYANQALKLRPDYEEAKILVGEIMQTQGRSRAAIELYKTIPLDSPYAWTIGLRIADELDALGHEKEMLETLAQLEELRPERFETHLRKGDMFRGAERFAEAADAYDEAIKRIDENNSRYWALFYYRGIAFERQKKWPKAEADFLKALELSPDQPHVLNYLAYSWVELKKNLEQAEKMLIKAVELRPDDGYVVDSLGWVYYRLGKFDEAVKYLEKAIELKAEDPVINDHLGDAYWQVGRKHEARFQWRRALSFEPEEEQVELIRSKIDKGIVADNSGS
ncbi:tetratricopeptide repeat protein [Kiloniella litopenaei]|uniref:tetratricopeptide repeat protein n=1 Tax=Kiloniella litopenaei TaxID=1549748 RepID=UPI000AD14A85|nr:tetratricopeptide repeat protein [Kiloniella litopenaei]